MSEKEYFPPDPDLITTSRQSIDLTVMACVVSGFALNSLGCNRSHLEVAVLYKMTALYPSLPEDELAIYTKEGVNQALRFIEYLGVFGSPDGGLQ